MDETKKIILKATLTIAINIITNYSIKFIDRIIAKKKGKVKRKKYKDDS